jgi:hypothetical protein
MFSHDIRDWMCYRGLDMCPACQGAFKRVTSLLCRACSMRNRCAECDTPAVYRYCRQCWQHRKQVGQAKNFF